MAPITPKGSGNQPSSPSRPKSSNSAPVNELHLLRQHVDSQLGAMGARIEAQDMKMDGKIATVTAALAKAEADRTVALNDLTNELRDVQKNLPTSKTISRTIWTAAGTTVLALITAAGLAWAIFDTGGGFVGSFAEGVLETKQQQQEINNKLDRLIESPKSLPSAPNSTEGAKPDAETN